MSKLRTAIQLDIRQNLEDAAKFYELSLREESISVGAYINLACIYWVSIEPGNNVSTTFYKQASKRVYQVLDEGQKKFEYVPEIRFWKLYFNFTMLGDSSFTVEALKLTTQKPETLVPYFHVYDQTRNPKYKTKTQELLNQAREELTTKNRYIISLIESCGLN